VTFWKDSRTLFAHALAVTRDNAIAHQGLGNALLEAGEIQSAITHFEAAARLAPDLPDLQGNLGAALGAAGRYDEAAEHFRAALRTRETTGLHFDLGSALVGQGRLDEAIGEYEGRGAAGSRRTSKPHAVGRGLRCGAVLSGRHAGLRTRDRAGMERGGDGGRRALRGAAPEIPGRDALAPRVARWWTGRVTPRGRRPAVGRAARCPMLPSSAFA